MAPRADWKLMLERPNGQRDEIGGGTGVVPVVGDLLYVRDEPGAPVVTLVVFARAFDTIDWVWLVYARLRTAQSVNPLTV